MFRRTPNGITVSREDFREWHHKFKLKNNHKYKAKAMKMWWWEKMDDEVECFKRLSDGSVRVPLGIAGWVRTIDSGMEPFPKVTFPQFLEIVPYDHQEQAVTELIRKPVGLLHAPTWSGKTVMAMLMAQKIGVRTLVVTKDITLMTQFVKDVKEKMGLTVKYYGGSITQRYLKTVDTDDLVVTTIQSADKCDVKSFGLVILDEVHTMLGAEKTWAGNKQRKLIGNLTNPYVYGMTGTPDVNGVDNRVFNVYVGPLTKCHVETITPDYRQVVTSFEYDVALTDPRKKTKWIQWLKAAMYADPERNEKIVTRVISTIGNRKWLVFTEYIEHAYLLYGMLKEHWIGVHVLTGKDGEGNTVNIEERERIKQYVKDTPGPQVIVGSVRIIGTGFDLPELSIAYLTTMNRFGGNLMQYVGRIVRKHPMKAPPVFHDFSDVNVPFTESQASSRAKDFRKAFPWAKITIDI